MRRLPWVIWVVTVAIGIAVAPAAMKDGLLPFVSYTVFVLAFATVGALVASRHPRNPIGWLLLLAGLSYTLGGVTVDAAQHGDPGAWQDAAAWIGAWIWMAGIGPVATFGLLLFPDGHLPSRRWRPVAWLAGGGLAALLLGLATAPGSFADTDDRQPDRARCRAVAARPAGRGRRRGADPRARGLHRVPPRPVPLGPPG